MCDRFKVLPSQVLAEDPELLRLVTVADLARPRPVEDGGG